MFIHQGRNMSDQYHSVHKTVIIVWYNWLPASEMVFIKLSKKKKILCTISVNYRLLVVRYNSTTHSFYIVNCMDLSWKKSGLFRVDILTQLYVVSHKITWLNDDSYKCMYHITFFHNWFRSTWVHSRFLVGFVLLDL